MLRYKTGILLLLFAAVSVFLFTASYRPAVTPFHTKDELKTFQGERARIDSGEYFLGSIRCKGCHGFDTLHHSNIDADSNDINLYDDWESTMMALSSKDPLWRAKVSHEIMVNPGHSVALQTKCTSCHAPMGHFSAVFKGAQSYTLSDMLQDTLGLNGVACGGCHEIASDSLIGLEFSGNIHYDTSKVEYGPFEDPLVGPMQLYVGLIPTHSLHMGRSQVCAACHTLQTAAVDLNGNPTGTYFVEQATFHEWLNSSFNSDQPCQSCHMPQVQDPVIIANNILNLSPRSPFNMHKFMGGNTTMLKMMKQNKSSLGIDAPDANFDSTITATMDLLQHATLDMVTQIDSSTNDTLFVSVALTNKAGHKFPSGYPSRRAFIQFAVTNATDTVFQSGMLRPDYEVTGQGALVEPHYNIISDSTQAQIYEMAMGDVNGNFTTVLERAYTELKDNRIPPSGFTTSHYSYDTAKIVGAATTDPDFNLDGTVQGTGRDIVHYHIPLRGKGGALHVSAAVYYQVLPPRWVTEMFSYNSDFIDSFRNMYQLADKAPVLVAHNDADTTVIISSLSKINSSGDLKIFPVPSSSGNIWIQPSAAEAISKIEVWDAAGRKVSEASFREKLNSYPISLPAASGIYYLRMQGAKGAVVRKVVRE
jgi:hypothetical protein